MKQFFFYIFVLAIVSKSEIYSQNICSTCDKLKKNVVKIHTIFNNNDAHGFGTVIAETNNKLFIVTAKHVINSVDDPDRKTKTVSVKFFYDQGKDYPATLLDLGNNKLDIGLLEVAKPKDYVWERNYYSIDIKKGTRVWFIGRKGEWYIPTGSFIGSINDVSPDDEILIDINSIEQGTSGAPLVSQDGIVGVIFEDAGRGAIAYPIEKIIKLITKTWNYPWQMNLKVSSSSVQPDDDILTDEEITQKILGTWKGPLSCEGHFCEATISYNSNGTLTGITVVDNVLYYRYTGIWKVTNKENRVTVTNSDNTMYLPKGTTFRSKILTITGNKSEYIDDSGVARTATRLK